MTIIDITYFRVKTFGRDIVGKVWGMDDSKFRKKNGSYFFYDTRFVRDEMFIPEKFKTN